MSVTIELPPDIDARIEELSAKWGREKSALVQDIIENGIDEVDLYYRAIEIRDGVEAGEIKTYSAEEVRRRLDLED